MHKSNTARHASDRLGPVVIKIGGAALDGAANTALVAATIRALHQQCPSNLIVVHGGGIEVDSHLARLGIASEKRDGIRVTPPEHIDEVVAVLAGKMNKRLVGALQKTGIRAVGLCIGDGQLLHTAKATHYPFDPGQVGCAIGGDPSLLQVLRTGGFLPVVCSIGIGADGQALNVNADEAAAALARLLGASSLILLTDVPGVLDTHGEFLERLTTAEIELRIGANEITGGMIPKVRGAASIADDLQIPVTIASWREVSIASAPSGQTASGTRVIPCGASAGGFDQFAANTDAATPTVGAI